MTEVANEQSPLPVFFSSMNTGISADTLRPVAWLGRFAQAAGCDGVDFAPIFPWAYGHTPTAVRYAVNRGDLVMGGLHAPIRGSEKGHGSTVASYRPAGLMPKIMKLALMEPHGRLIMPTDVGSAPLLDRYQDAAGQRLPICFFPQPDVWADLRQLQRAKGARSLFQLKDETAHYVGATDLADFDEQYTGVRGYSGYIFGSAHMRVPQTERRLISNFEQSAEALAPKARAVHIEVARTDLGPEIGEKTFQEGIDLLNGRVSGELATILGWAKQGGNVAYAVLECQIGNMKELITTAFPEITNPSMQVVREAYTVMADAVRRYMGRPRAFS